MSSSDTTLAPPGPADTRRRRAITAACIGNFIEYYDIAQDPWQLDNSYSTLSSDRKAQLKKRLQAFRECQGTGCRKI